MGSRIFHIMAKFDGWLRSIVTEIGLDCQFDNAFLWDGTRKNKDIRYLSGVVVIALGRIAEIECIRQGIKCCYLPHPACRSKAQIESLREGLLGIPTQREPDLSKVRAGRV